MSEPCAAYIEIGGELTSGSRAELAAAIHLDYAGLSWGEACDEDEALQAIDEAIAKGESLSVFDDQANYGNIETVEGVCKRHGLHWRHHCDAHFSEWSAMFRVGVGEEFVEIGSDASGYPVVGLDVLRKAHAEGPAAVQRLIDATEPATLPLPPLTMKATP